MNTKRLFLAPAAFALLALTGCSGDFQTNANIDHNLREAQRQARIGNTAQAKVWADRAIAVDPKNQATYTGASEDDDQSPMAQAFRSTEPPVSLAGIFQEVGDDPTLIAYMRDATNKFPDDVAAWQNLIDAEERLGQNAQKVQDAKKLAAQLEISRKKKVDGTVLAALGQAYYDSGDEINGEKNYRQAIATYSTDPAPLNGLAYHYAVTNNKAHLTEALALANQAINLIKTQATGASGQASDSDLAGELDTLAWVQYRLGDYNSALANQMDAAAGLPGDAEVRYHLGMIYLAMGDKFAARTELRHAILLSPDYAEAETQANLLQNVPPPKPDPADDEE